MKTEKTISLIAWNEDLLENLDNPSGEWYDRQKRKLEYLKAHIHIGDDYSLTKAILFRF